MIALNYELNNRPSKDGRHKILIRITRNRKHARIATDIFVVEKSFNSKAKYGKWIRSSDDQYHSKNKQLLTLYEELHKFCTDICKDNPSIDVSSLASAFKDSTSGENTSLWLDFFNRCISDYRSTKKYRYAIKMNAVATKYKEYLNGKNPAMEATSVESLREFQKYLYSIGNSINTVHINLKILKQVYRRACEESIVLNPNYGVLEFKSKTVAVERDKLTEEELHQLQNLNLEVNSRLWHVRNYFLFAVYAAGIRFGDFVQLRRENFTKGSHLKYRMGKNQKIQSLKLPKDGEDIVAYYLALVSKPKEFVFPILPSNFDSILSGEDKLKVVNAKNSLINNGLKELMVKANIEKKVTFHTSRHTFAYLGFKKTKDVVAIQQLLKHSKLAETQSYITSLTNEKERDTLGEIFS